MLGYRPPITVSLPEMSAGPGIDYELFNRMFVRVMDADIPGFVMRQAASWTENSFSGQPLVSNDSTRERIVSIVSPDVVMSECTEQIPIEKEGIMRGDFHTDANDAPLGDTQMNIYVPVTGEVKVGLVPFRSARQGHIARGKRYEASPADKRKFRENGHVAIDWFYPIKFVAQVGVGDVLVFADALNGHHFDTTVAPRKSYANIFHARHVR